MKSNTFDLTNENIQKYVKSIRELGKMNNADERMTTETCLALEEILINNQSHFGDDQSVNVLTKKRFGELIITLSLRGESYTPFDGSIINEEGVLQQSIGIVPRYSYSYGLNRVTLVLECNKNKWDLVLILFAVVLGLVIGIGGSYMPAEVIEPCHIVVSALSDAIFGLMKMAAMPVIFLCVIIGIIGSGSVKIFKLNGFHILKKQILSMLIMLLFTSVLCISAFGIRISTASSDIEFVQILVDNIFSIVPDNIIAPFVDSDNVKIIILGIMFGSALLALEDKVNLVDSLVIQLKEACSLVLTWVGKLIPVLVAVLLVDNIWSGNFGIEVLSMWKIAVVYLVVAAVILVLMILRVAHEQKVGFGRVFSAVIGPGIKGIVSGSTMLCYYDMIDGLTNRLNIPESRANFGIPLGIAFFQPSSLLLAVNVLFFVSSSGMDVDFSWMVSFYIITYVTSISTPPVTGGVVSLLAILFTALSITDPMTAVAFPLLMFLDYPATGFRVMTMMLNVAKE